MKRPAELKAPAQKDLDKLRQACAEYLDAQALDDGGYEQSKAYEAVFDAALGVVYGPDVFPYLNHLDQL